MIKYNVWLYGADDKIIAGCIREGLDAHSVKKDMVSELMQEDAIFADKNVVVLSTKITKFEVSRWKDPRHAF